MNFTKKANDFGVFGNVLVVNNDLFSSVSVTKVETKEDAIKTAEDGNMCHMKDYVHETGNNIPQEIWDYIYKLTNDK